MYKSDVVKKNMKLSIYETEIISSTRETKQYI
jgi:hypothetical protein